ncbi:TlpA family protein disulfide reductase, partial [Salmonella sp. M241]|uniref:TlpA family protein disulfide reductase n=1 Tax=Salmonella sp. M241 TaxID=3240299 RepID=UPI00352A1858
SASVGGRTANPANEKLRAAPEFALADSSGKVHRLADLRGNTVMVHFWASWCPPCLEEIPQFLEAARAPQGRSIRWVAITEDEKWEDALKML